MELLIGYDFSRSEAQSVPALDIEEIIDKRLWETTNLTDEQTEILQKGRDYLDLALIGKSLVDRAVNENIFSGDLIAIKAWETAKEVVGELELESKPEGEEIIVKKIREVIDNISERDEISEQKIIEPDIEISRNFFLIVSKLPQSNEGLGFLHS